MTQLNYAIEDSEGRPILREYVYHVGSFHYNWHREIELLCVLSGQVEVCSGASVYDLEEDDLLLINANVGHATLSRAVDSTILLLRVDPSFFRKGCPDFERRQIHLCSDRHTRGEARFARLRRCMAQLMLSHFSDDPLDSFAFDAALNALAWLLLRDFAPQLPLSAVYSGREDTKNVQEMIQFLEARYREKITLQDMARRWNYSPTYASQLFKEAVGINFYDYLTRIRLRQATRDLTETDRKILDIAADNGFQDLKSFNTKFREIFGRSPSDYRRSLGEDHVRYDATFKKTFVDLDDGTILEKLRAYADPQAPDAPAAPAPERPAAAGPDPKALQAMAQELIKIARRLTDPS